jgi:hypothetical protein
MLEIPDLTLCCAFTLSHELHLMAIEDCLSRVKFGDVKIFSDRIGPDITNIEGEDFSNFVYNVIPSKIKTSHILFIQWDSWVINPYMWKNEFLDYDYIGAPWGYTDGLNVGNSGFCIRSKALLDYLVAHRQQFPIGEPEDGLLCRYQRLSLPQFKWASTETAQDFSFERTKPSIESLHFGFHGIFNWPFVLRPDELSKRMKIARKDPYIQKSGMLRRIDQISEIHWLKPPILQLIKAEGINNHG